MPRQTDLRLLLLRVGNVTARELMQQAEARGWRLDRVRGSHHIYVKAGSPIQISIPVRLKGTGTARNIINDLIDEEEGNNG